MTAKVDEVVIDDEEEPIEGDDRIELLPYEQEVMLDTMDSDVLFITATGLGVERLCLHHLHMYNDPKVLVLVINTKPADDHFFLTKLKALNPSFPPKLINSDVPTQQREAVYLSGGVQFITSRVLMVDLLTERLPTANVAGIVVYHAHELLGSFQESFILRLYRERKATGFVKAFSDRSGAIASAGLGQLQRLFNKLYVREVRLLPRFDALVKATFDATAPHLVELEVELPVAVRRVHMNLIDIIRTCVRELKQTASGLDVETEDEAKSPSAGLKPTRLELDLRAKTLLLTDRQERLLSDLGALRALLRKVEGLDPYSALRYANKLRRDKNIVERSSGWLMTPTAGKIFSGLEALCQHKANPTAPPLVAIPPKWGGLHTALAELMVDHLDDDAKVLVLCPNDECCSQLVDVVKFGSEKFQWLLSKAALTELNSSAQPPSEPATRSWWDPSCIVTYNFQVDMAAERKTLVSSLQSLQKVKKRRREPPPSTDCKKMRQASLVQFGIVKYKEKQAKNHQNSETSGNGEATAASAVRARRVPDGIGSSAMLVFLTCGERYNLINSLEILKPVCVVLYHLDLAAMRLIEIYNAKYPERKLKIYTIMYKESAEEERYLLAVRNEQTTFEDLIREQGVLVVPKEYDVSRESASRLRPVGGAPLRDSRDAAVARARGDSDDASSKIIVDMREFNAELPTVLYKRGIDVVATTLEVGDYILSPSISVERKALDDLAQSLNNGRVFKQIEQMEIHYSRPVLLIESRERFKHRKVCGGAFQGELSRRCRETRSLLAMLVRGHPKMTLIWASMPRNSAEFFEEMKVNEPNPDVAEALAKLAGDLSEDRGTNYKSARSGGRINVTLKRQLCRLPGVRVGDVEAIMTNGVVRTVKDIFTADVRTLIDACGNNTSQASALHAFFSRDFRF